MPESENAQNFVSMRRVARIALVAGVAITIGKFIVFSVTGSVAVLSDALESIINIAAAGMMIYSLWLAARPADKDHPFGHGKVEFLSVGMEGWFILFAAVVIFYEAITRLIAGSGPENVGWGLIGMVIVTLASGALGFYVWRSGKKMDSPVLRADGVHLLTDLASSIGVLIALVLIQWTGFQWLDSVIALIVGGFILWASWRLLGKSINGLMDRQDPEDDRAIRAILDDQVARKNILGYHKVRHRHYGSFHWINMHLQVPGDITIAQGHDIASQIEYKIEQELGPANATAHVEPPELTGSDRQEDP